MFCVSFKLPCCQWKDRVCLYNKPKSSVIFITVLRIPVVREISLLSEQFSLGVGWVFTDLLSYLLDKIYFSACWQFKSINNRRNHHIFTRDHWENKILWNVTEWQWVQSLTKVIFYVQHLSIPVIKVTKLGGLQEIVSIFTIKGWYQKMRYCPVS